MALGDTLKGHEEAARLRHFVRSIATRLDLDDYLRCLRNVLHPVYRRDHIDNQHLRLLLTFALKENSNCIDVGAYRGTVLIEMLRVAPQGKHIAYEPLPFMHNYLVGHFPTVDVRQTALSNEKGERNFTYVKHMIGYSGFCERSCTKRSPIEKITVRTETLDNSLPVDYMPDLIKIDVEGAERLAIEGAIETISKYKALVVSKHGKSGAVYYDTQPRDMYELLHGRANLRIFDLDGNGPYTLAQFEEVYARNSRWNFVACR